MEFRSFKPNNLRRYVMINELNTTQYNFLRLLILYTFNFLGPSDEYMRQ